MSLEKLQSHWDHFGSEDPMFAVLTDPDKKGGKWDEDSFYATGREEIAKLLSSLDRHRILFKKRRALDFGCGAGRLSQALAEHFDKVSGIDIAPSMIHLAESNNRFPDRLTFHLNSSNSLPFPQFMFDFLYSNYVLQHIAPEYAKRYIAEFMRVLDHSGVAVFQFTSAPRATSKRLLAQTMPAFMLKAYRRLRFGKHYMEMHGIPVEEVEQIVADNGGQVLRMVHVEADDNWQSHICYAMKIDKDPSAIEPNAPIPSR